MIRRPLSDPQQATKAGRCHVLRAGLLIGFCVLVPPRASGQATFSEARPVAAPPLHDLAVVDLDGDGDPDLVGITADHERAHALVWFENDGAGSFAPPQTLLTDLPSSALALKTTDLNGDGAPDLLVGNASPYGFGGLFWAANEGGQFGSFEAIEPVESGPFVAVDFEGDGDLDVLQGGLYVGLYENTGRSGSRRFRRAHALAPGPAGILAAADFDDDGDADLIASLRGFERNNDLVFYYEQEEPGSLRFTYTHELLSFTREVPMYDRLISAMELTDINGDGRSDVVVGAYLNSDVGPVEGQVRWYKNSSFSGGPVFLFSGLITYQDPEASGTWGPEALTVGDFDGDGDNDVALAKASHGPEALVWYENPGAEAGDAVTWPEHPVGISNRLQRVLQAADLNGDGRVDLVSLNGPLAWYENLGTLGTSTESPQDDRERVPEALRLEAVWPNPSSGAVTVAYQVRQAGRVRLEVFDVLGRLVAAFEEQPRRAGAYQAELDLRALAAGTYVLRLKAARDGVAMRRIVLR